MVDGTDRRSRLVNMDRKSRVRKVGIMVQDLA